VKPLALKRGDIYTAATGSGYGSKPRPVLIIQADAFRMMSKTLVILIGQPVEGAGAIRVLLEPDATNGLREVSEVMVDAILPVRPENFGRHVGSVSDSDLRRVEHALLVFLGINSAQ